jgi:hypothetical protein
MATKIGEYRSKRIYKIGAKIVEVKVMFDRLSRVHGRNEKDNVHLEVACRYAIKVGIHVLDEVILELKSEQMEWRRVQRQRYWANFDSLVAKLVEVRVVLDELGRVHGRNEKDTEHLRIALRYAMKSSAVVLNDVVWQLNMEHIERLQEDPEWRKVEAESIRQIMEEYAERKDAEFHKLSDEAEESTR